MDAGPDLDHDSRALMAENGREEAFGIGARTGELVGVADAGRLDLDHDLALARALEAYGLDLQRCSGLVGHGGAYVHAIPLSRRGLSSRREQ